MVAVPVLALNLCSALGSSLPCACGAAVGPQGEDVVAGIRTPEDIEAMRQGLPSAYDELLRNCEILENHYKDMQVRLLLSPFCNQQD